MKVATVFVATLATAAAFAPAAQNGRVETSMAAEKKSFFKTVFDMDLFAPNPDINSYGARDKKNIKLGSIGSNSYVPNGLTAAQYAKLRQEEAAKRDQNYKKNVAKAGKYIDFTDWYTKRGTDISDAWVKTVSRGHTFAKTKFDYSGKKDVGKKFDGSK